MSPWMLLSPWSNLVVPQAIIHLSFIMIFTVILLFSVGFRVSNLFFFFSIRDIVLDLYAFWFTDAVVELILFTLLSIFWCLHSHGCFWKLNLFLKMLVKTTLVKRWEESFTCTYEGFLEFTRICSSFAY